MRVTISLDDELVKKVRKIAAERGTTLTALVRAYLRGLVAQHDNAERDFGWRSGLPLRSDRP